MNKFDNLPDAGNFVHVLFIVVSNISLVVIIIIIIK